MIESGAAYLRAVGPSYGFFGLGLALYFASQGAGRLFWPLIAGFLRMLVAYRRRLAGAASDRLARWLFAALALGMVLHGVTVLAAIASGAWFRKPQLQTLVPYAATRARSLRRPT